MKFLYYLMVMPGTATKLWLQRRCWVAQTNVPVTHRDGAEWLYTSPISHKCRDETDIIFCFAVYATGRINSKTSSFHIVHLYDLVMAGLSGRTCPALLKIHLSISVKTPSFQHCWAARAWMGTQKYQCLAEPFRFVCFFFSSQRKKDVYLWALRPIIFLQTVILWMTLGSVEFLP